PVIMVQNVSFRYSSDTFGIDLDTRVALVGPNGAGKSTLLKLLMGEVTSSHRRNDKKAVACQDWQLELDLSPLEYMMKCFPEIKEKEEMRKIIGRYGLTGKQQKLVRWPEVSGVFRLACMLFLDEPTNHLDIETIDALAEAINEFEGGMMLVSHDFRLIQQVAQEIWVCEKQTITKWNGDILAYKEHLKSKIDKQTHDI
uniref:ATP-binding cassette, sub-family F (GCN20), member 2b n=1 Tax=Sinocyclocheilus rhinocerous TaxID=307959 RepID=A0A673J219_9TELE